MDCLLSLAVLLMLAQVALLPSVQAVQCACSTEECKRELKFSCSTDHICYVQYLASAGVDDDRESIVRGCIYERTPLLCENRRPQKLWAHAPWPILYCCEGKDFCNQDVLPTIPAYIKEGMNRMKNETSRRKPPPPLLPMEPIPETGPRSELKPRKDSTTKCSDSLQPPLPVSRSPNGNHGHRTINPIYIAVPLAGVCVLLALIIFAMYLLKRRNTYYDHYPYHTHVSTLHPHCHIDPKRTVPKMNRCTDSERSSSGSESKLFIQA